MTEPMALTKQGTDEVMAYACGKCGTVYTPRIYINGQPDDAKRAANECCGLRECQGGCGKKVDPRKESLTCRECFNRELAKKERERAEKAEKFTVETLPKDTPLYYGDEHFSYDFDSFAEWARDQDLRNMKMPMIVWLCDKRKPQVDVDGVIEHLSEQWELGDGVSAEDVCEDIDELAQVMHDWNAKQKDSLWYPSSKRVMFVTLVDLDVCASCFGTSEDTEGHTCATCGGTGEHNRRTPV